MPISQSARDIMSCPSIQNHPLIQTFPPNDNEVGRDFAERDRNRVSSSPRTVITFGIFQAVNARDVDDKMAKNPASQQFLLPCEMAMFPFSPVTKMPPRNFHLAILHNLSLESRHTMLPERLSDRYFMCRRVYIGKMLNCLTVNILNQRREPRNGASYSRSVQKFSLNVF